jgi:hypothetical protein
VKTTVKQNLIVAALVCAFLALSAFAAGQEVRTDAGTVDRAEGAQVFKKPGYSPYAGRDFPTRVFFGDTHLHTSVSLDAAAVGCKVGPAEAYRFARGEEVISSTGQPAKLSRPLDFLVVSDHAEAFGCVVELMKGNSAMMTDPKLKQ